MTKYCDLIRQRSLGAIVIGAGLLGIEKMIVGDSQQGGVAKYVDLLGKVSIFAGIVGYGYSYFVSDNPQNRSNTQLNTREDKDELADIHRR